jgi:hypothetical protein
VRVEKLKSSSVVSCRISCIVAKSLPAQPKRLRLKHSPTVNFEQKKR